MIICKPVSAWRRLRVYNVLRWIEANTLSFTVVSSSCFITCNNAVFCSNKNSWLIIGFPILIMDLSPVIVPPTVLILTHCSLHQHNLCCSPDTASFPVVVRRVLRLVALMFKANKLFCFFPGYTSESWLSLYTDCECNKSRVKPSFRA